MPMVVRGYGRASTDKQIVTIEAQESVVKDAFELYRRIKPEWSDAVWGGFYREEAITRTSVFRERPIGSLVCAATRHGDVIMVAKYDRIFANVKDACDTLEMVEQRKFKLCILDLDVDISSDLGQAIFKVAAVFKELAAKDIRRNTREVLQYRKSIGRPASGAVPIGWKIVRVRLKDAGGKSESFFVIDEVQRKFARRFLTLWEMHGKTQSQFAGWLNEHGYRQPSGSRWTQVQVSRWMRAINGNFALPNGSHVAAPIPADAKAVETTFVDMDD